MPLGLDVTVPLPVPARVTLNANVEAVLNVAVTLRAAVIASTQEPVPVHAPFQRDESGDYTFGKMTTFFTESEVNAWL